MELNFLECETKERKYLLEYVVPFLNNKLTNLKYKFSDINSFDRKDMMITFESNGEQKKAVIECKIRIYIKPYYVDRGLLLELDKYNAIKKQHKNIPFYYVMFLEKECYIFNMEKLKSLYGTEHNMINTLYKRLKCNIQTCGKNKGKKFKPCLLLPTNTTASIKIKY